MTFLERPGNGDGNLRLRLHDPSAHFGNTRHHFLFRGDGSSTTDFGLRLRNQFVRLSLFGLQLNLLDPMHKYYFVFGFVALAMAVLSRILASPFGGAIEAVRENEARALSLGYNVNRLKLLAFVLSATLAGLAGSTKAIVLQIASLTDVDWPMSGEVVLMALVGGLGTVFGPVAGAFIVIAMQNYLAQVGQWVTVIQGVIFVICVLAFRRGVIGELAHYLRIKL